ncbi:CehA/McbA family metallohydrolase [Halobellus rubicundus]|uniref:CehA/McbA family metallohydrolase n=1 Tax=Halobellus rubicundus TaxID=2996466 RepID=A0ABD5MDU9_9EURY
MTEGRTVTVDPHLHTVASYDGHATPERLLDAAERAGLDAVVVTDHDTVEGARVAKTLAADRDVVVVVGCEVSTADGHLLAIGVHDAPEPGRPLPTTARAVRDRGGLAVVPHPFQRSRHGARADAIEAVDGIEVHNAHALLNIRNGQARSFAARRGYAMFGGSDAHRAGTVGLATTAVTLPPETDLTSESLVGAMRDGDTTAVGRRTSTWQYVSKLFANARYRTLSLV